jgi:hypothetical protein
MRRRVCEEGKEVVSEGVRVARGGLSQADKPRIPQQSVCRVVALEMTGDPVDRLSNGVSK